MSTTTDNRPGAGTPEMPEMPEMPEIPEIGGIAGIPGATGTPALRFAETARRLGATARAAGLTVPSFRCPPRVAGAARTIRRYPNGCVVSVRLRDRPFDEVVTDMVEGVLVANRLSDDAALRLRTSLLDAAHRGPAAPDPGAPVPSTPSARMAERQTQAA